MTAEDCLIIHGEINKLQTELMEAYKAIVDNSMYTYWCPEYKDSVELCTFCEEEEHDKNCIVLKAEQYIEDNK